MITINDFVIMIDQQPYRIRLLGPNSYWMYYWHEANKNWVALKAVKLREVTHMWALKLPDDQCKLYEAGVPFKE